MTDATRTPADFEAEPPIVRPDDLPLIIAEWELLSREEPWHVDPHRYGIDSLHETIKAVLDIAIWGGTDAFVTERLVRTAAAHGEQRRAQGAHDDALLREYNALRTAIWRFLQRTSPRGPAGLAAILRVDVAIGVATTVSLRGYHRGELPAGTTWEADILKQVAAVSRQLVDLLREGVRS